MEEIIHAAKELGINYKIFTSSKTSEFYSDHQWSVIQNSQVGPVINAVPDIKIADTVPWEEWFLMDGIIHHHILNWIHLEKKLLELHLLVIRMLENQH